jgi:hypothetical protein
MALQAQSGVFSSASTWVGGIVPILGEGITNSAGMTLTLDSDVSVGTGVAGDSVSIYGTIVNSSFKFTIDGNMTVYDGGIYQYGAGSETEFTGNYSLLWRSGSQIIGGGTSLSRASIRATTGNVLTFSALHSDTRSRISCPYTTFTNLGTMLISGQGSAYQQDVLFQNSLFDHYGMIRIYPGETPLITSTLKFIDCDFRSPTHADHAIYLSKTFSISADSHEISGCTFYSTLIRGITLNLTSTNDFKFLNNKISGYTLQIRNVEVRRNYFYTGIYQVNSVQNVSEAIISENFFFSQGINNPHTIQLGASAVVENNVSIISTVNSDGNHILASEADLVVATIERNLTIGDNGVVVRGDRPSCNILVNRHTHKSTVAGGSEDLVIVETPNYTGLIRVRSSLLSTSVGGRLVADPEGSETTLIAGCEADYNSIYNTVFSTRYSVPISGKVLGDAGYGSMDISANPEFRNNNATVLTLDSSLGGDGSISNFNAKMFSSNGFDLFGAAVSPDPAYNVDVALNYFTDSYTPTNSELQGAGLGGVDIGAFDVEPVGTTYNVTYNGNTNTSGTPPTDANEYAELDNVTVLGQGTLAKTGNTFGGWNTQADGLGTHYDESDTFPMGTTDVELFAQWSVDSHDVIFNSNGGSGTIANQSIDYGTAENLTVNSFTRTGHAFNSWNTAANGSGTAYVDQTSFTMGLTNVTLYAQWAVNTYYVLFDANTGVGSVANQGINYGASANLTANTFTKLGFNFGNWNTAANGSGTTYANQASFTMANAINANLYAQWAIANYTITYILNGGTNSNLNPATYNINTPTITFAPPTKTGYLFLGWSISTIPQGTTGNITTTATWAPVVYEITYNLRGGINNPLNPENYTIDSDLITFLPPTKIGAIFIEWSRPTIQHGTTGNISTTARWDEPSTDTKLTPNTLRNSIKLSM